MRHAVVVVSLGGAGLAWGRALPPRPGCAARWRAPAAWGSRSRTGCRSPPRRPRSSPSARRGPGAPGPAAARTGRRRARRRAPASAGSSIHSQDGDRIEKPANTGCSTHGDFSAPMVSPLGTTGDRPAAITRISSGVSAAITRGLAASSATAPRPAQPYSPRRDPSGTSRAEHDHADEPDERDPGEPGGQRHRRAGERERQPPAERGHPELLHQRLEQEPLRHEPRRGRQPGQGERAHREAGAAPRRPPSHAAQHLEVVAARRAPQGPRRS